MKVLVLLGALLFALLPGAAFSATDRHDDFRFHPFTMDGCTDAPVHGDHADCDPVNLLFPGKTVTQVYGALLSRGWTVWGFGSTQYLHLGDERLVPQTLQLFRYDSWDRRYHIRLWQTTAGTIGSVHHEEGIFEHIIDQAWEATEAFVARQLCTGQVRCEQTRVLDDQFATQGRDQEWRGWANNARATVINLRR